MKFYYNCSMLYNSFHVLFEQFQKPQIFKRTLSVISKLVFLQGYEKELTRNIFNKMLKTSIRKTDIASLLPIAYEKITK